MADPRFFSCRGPFSVADIAAVCGAMIARGGGEQMIDDVAPLEVAEGNHLSFIDNRKYRDSFRATRAGVCLMRPEMQDQAPANMVCLVTSTPYKAYALAAQKFYPAEQPEPVISTLASVHPGAVIGPGCRIDPFAVIGEGVEMGVGCWIESGVVIGSNVKIGRGVRVGASASISHAHIGNHSRIYPGARIGQDGFGFAIDPKGFVKVPQLGRVIIEDHVEIGANTCIDRGAGPDTVIGMGTWIDNLVQIAHNVRIGRGCILTGQVGIAGSTVIDDFVAIGGQTGIAGHLHIGKGAQLAAGSGVIADIPPGTTVMGYPALPKTQFLRHVAYLNRATARMADHTKDVA